MYADASAVYTFALLNPAEEPDAEAAAVAVSMEDLQAPVAWLQQAVVRSLTRHGGRRRSARMRIGRAGHDAPLNPMHHFHVAVPAAATATAAASVVNDGPASVAFENAKGVQGFKRGFLGDPGMGLSSREDSAEVAALVTTPKLPAELMPEVTPASGSSSAHLALQGLNNLCLHKNYLLYLGMNIPGGKAVTKVDLDAFLKEEVHPRVDGFTMWPATGFWKGESEATAIIEVIGEDNSLVTAVAAIAAAYKQAFHQEAVLVKQNMCPAVALL